MSYTLPQSNVRLVDISSPGHAGDYDRPSGSPVSKWHGSVGAYLKDSIVTNFGGSAGGELNRINKSTLIIPGDLSPRIELAIDDLVTYEFQDGSTKNWHSTTRRIQTFATPVVPAPALPTTVSIALIDAPA